MLHGQRPPGAVAARAGLGWWHWRRRGTGGPGVVSAIVTDVRDPENLCRVKVKFPAMSDSYESDWARTVQAGAGRRPGQR